MIDAGRVLVAGLAMPVLMQLHVVLAAPSLDAARVAFLVGIVLLLLLLRWADADPMVVQVGVPVAAAAAVLAIRHQGVGYRLLAGLAQLFVVLGWLDLARLSPPGRRARKLAAGGLVAASAGFALYCLDAVLASLPPDWTVEARSATTRVLGTVLVEAGISAGLWTWLALVWLQRRPQC